jgi:hypothetical protein
MLSILIDSAGRPDAALSAFSPVSGKIGGGAGFEAPDDEPADDERFDVPTAVAPAHPPSDISASSDAAK